MPSKITGRVLEREIQREICDWLDSEHYFFWRNNTVPIFSEGKFRAMPKYSARGLPDIIIVHRGKFVGMEVKRPFIRIGLVGGTPETTAAQTAMKLKILTHGGFYFLVTSLEEAKQSMNEIA